MAKHDQMPKGLAQKVKDEHRRKWQSLGKGERKEMEIILLHKQKNIWAFSRHMDYGKD